MMNINRTNIVNIPNMIINDCGVKELTITKRMAACTIYQNALRSSRVND